MIVERTPPATLPVTIEAVRRHLRIEGTHADALLADLIGAAAADLEGQAMLALVAQTVRVTWPDGIPAGTGKLRLPIGPLIAPAAPVTMTVDGEAFADFVVLPGPRPCLRLTVNPPELTRAVVAVEYTAGWPGAVPDDLAFAVIDQAAVLFDAGSATLMKDRALDGRAALSPAFQRAVGRWRGVAV